MAQRQTAHLRSATGASSEQSGDPPQRDDTPLPLVVAFPFAGPELHVVRGELLGHARLHCCDDPAELVQIVADADPAMVLAAVRDRTGTCTAPIIGHVHRAFPRVPVVAYCELTYADTRGAVAAGNAGVRHVLVRGYDSARAMLDRVIAEASRHELADLMVGELGSLAAGPLGWLVHYCLMNGQAPLSVEDVARARGVSCNTLGDQLRRRGLASPARIISWCRLLLAAAELESPGRTVTRVARELGFTSDSELRMMLRRYTGLRFSDVRGRGGVLFLARCFHAWLCEHRRIGTL